MPKHLKPATGALIVLPSPAALDSRLPPKKPPQSAVAGRVVGWPSVGDLHRSALPVIEFNSVSEQLAAVAQLSRKRLQQRWLQLFAMAPHPRLSRSMLIAIVSYGIQEQAYGALSREMRTQLPALNERGPRSRAGTRSVMSVQNEATAAMNAPGEQDAMALVRRKAPRTQITLKPGTRLLRQWRGHTYAVMGMEEGFELGGEKYKSLSEIARVITGTRWSGPLFFGLKQRGEPPGVSGKKRK